MRERASYKKEDLEEEFKAGKDRRKGGRKRKAEK